jgi:cyclopropane fatty-acyl-phospholipid synthase-like methyltransferase
LDAGCGVGFGCQELAKHTQAAVTGISLSAEEIAQAQSSADEAGLHSLTFKQQSFEELPASQYDCILMVESLKHCSDLDLAMNSIAGALRSKGVCYVVEDVYVAPENSSTDESRQVKQLCNDWHLQALWRTGDLKKSAASAGMQLQVKSDLTLHMKISSRFLVKTKLVLFSLLSRAFESSVYPIYRGGFILDLLYAQNNIRHQVLELRREGDLGLDPGSEH